MYIALGRRNPAYSLGVRTSLSTRPKFVFCHGTSSTSIYHVHVPSGFYKIRQLSLSNTVIFVYASDESETKQKVEMLTIIE